LRTSDDTDDAPDLQSPARPAPPTRTSPPEPGALAPARRGRDPAMARRNAWLRGGEETARSRGGRRSRPLGRARALTWDSPAGRRPPIAAAVMRVTTCRFLGCVRERRACDRRRTVGQIARTRRRSTCRLAGPRSLSRRLPRSRCQPSCPLTLPRPAMQIGRQPRPRRSSRRIRHIHLDGGTDADGVMVAAGAIGIPTRVNTARTEGAAGRQSSGAFENVGEEPIDPLRMFVPSAATRP
jgi:hypothetical protein